MSMGDKSSPLLLPPTAVLDVAIVGMGGGAGMLLLLEETKGPDGMEAVRTGVGGGGGGATTWVVVDVGFVAAIAPSQLLKGLWVLATAVAVTGFDVVCAMMPLGDGSVEGSGASS